MLLVKTNCSLFVDPPSLSTSPFIPTYYVHPEKKKIFTFSETSFYRNRKTTMAASTMIQVEFSDFVDLQTRLVLLPRIEEEGRGAVVASYINNSNASPTVTDNVVATRENPQVQINDNDDAPVVNKDEEPTENDSSEDTQDQEENNAVRQEDQSSLEDKKEIEQDNKEEILINESSSSSKVENEEEQDSNNKCDNDVSENASDNEETEKMDDVSISSAAPLNNTAGDNSSEPVPTSETMSRGDTPMVKRKVRVEENEEVVDDDKKEETPCSIQNEEAKEEDSDKTHSRTSPSSNGDHNDDVNKDDNCKEKEIDIIQAQHVIEEIHIVGKMLVGIGEISAHNDDGNNQCHDNTIAEMDFTDILSAIRQAPTPIILQFEPQPLILEEEEKSNKDTVMIAVAPPNKKEVIVTKEEEEDHDDGTASSNTQPQEEDDNDVDEDVGSDDNEATENGEQDQRETATSETQSSSQTAAIRGTLSSWGSRFKAEAGPTFASFSSAAARAAAEVSERAAKARSSTDQQEEDKVQTDTTGESGTSIMLKTRMKPPCCGLFLQSSGKFIPLDAAARAASSSTSSNSSNNNNNNHKNSSLPKVTNSSILIVRGTAQPDPSKKFSFQWWRSYSIEGQSESTVGSKSVTSQDGVVREWVILEGATFSAFQPSACDIGHRLRCVVTITKAPPEDDDDDSDDEDDEDEELVDEKEPDEEKLICELPEPVTADMSLFNGARTALLKGAKFNNMKGRGNANDRTFKINFEISSHSTPSPKNGRKIKTLTSAMSIFQVSGSTAEPMHEDKIMSASAISAPSQPKHFELCFPTGLPPSASMVSALSMDNGRFQLEAPNRITRETFLMALGIANFQGRPADLNEKTVLYPQWDDTAADVAHSPPTKEFSASDSESVKSDMDDSTSESSSVQAKGDAPETSISDDKKQPKSLAPKIDSSAEDERKIQELEQELERDLRTMQNKLAKKDKTVTKLQKQLSKSNTMLSKSAKDVKDYRKKLDGSNKSLRLAEKRIGTHEDTIARMKKDSASHVSTLESRIDEQSVTLAEMEKLVRSLQNEKAVLSAAVDARDGKLLKMGTLQAAVHTLSAEVSKGEVVQADLNKSNKRCKDLQDEMKRAKALETQRMKELEETRGRVKELEQCVAEERRKTTTCQAKVSTLQTQTQKLKSERNSTRQKADSLSKELSRICKNNMSLTDVEQIIQDDEARRIEVSLLRDQKRKALEELDLYRTAFDQSIAAQQKAGISGEAVRALEQNSELERVVADLTEYVNAKEMQLETMKEVNQALQVELHELAQKKTFDKNDI